MAEFAVAAAISILVPMALALLLDRLWPNAPTFRLALISGLFLPALLAGLFVAMYVDAAHHVADPGEIDATGMVLASALLLGPLAMAFSLVFGLPAAFETLERRRRGRMP